MAIFESINVPDDVRHAIANGIFTAITNDIPEIIQENNLPTSNGVGLFRWNYINRNISENLGGLLQTSLPKRGPFQFLLLFDETTGFTFSIMSEQNFTRLQRRQPENLHYLEALIANNAGYDITEG